MESQMYDQWVQAQIPETSQQNAVGVVPQHETARLDDWSKEPSQSMANLAAAGLTDLNEYATLADLPGPSNNPPPPIFNPYLTPNYLHFSSLNTIPYSTWQSASTPTPIPVSSYSSLNGATTATTPQPSQQSTQPPHQQSQQSQNQQSHQVEPTIDPLLTLNNTQTTFSQSSSSPTVQFQQHSQNGSQRTYSFSQPLLYTSYYRPQTQQQSPQGTLSPHALHMPMLQTNFYSHPQSQSISVTPSALTSARRETLSPPNLGAALNSASASGQISEDPEERKRKFLNFIRPLLQASAFSGAQAVLHLTDRIADFGVADVDAQTRLDILARIRDGAGNHYYRAWSENSLAVEITREWIKTAAKADSGALQETIMPLLHLIDRLPFNLESLAASKLGKVIKNLGKGERSAAIKDMANNLERRWRDMLTIEENNSKEDTKKRKGSDPSTTNKGAAAVKKAAVGGASSLKPVVVKKETRSTAPPVKDAKADSSFFSAPKPKAKLPTFKKAAVGLIKKEDTTASSSNNVSQPLNFDPFQEALKSIKAAKRDSPVVSTPPPQSSSSTDSADPQNLSTTLKKKKSVSWAPDGRLESIKLIERAVYDDDPTEIKYGMHSFRDLDREEGAALHAHLFEEAIDWFDPCIIEMPPDLDPNNPRMPRGHASQEKSTQEEREQTALSAVYMTPTQIPDSPAEPSTALLEEEVDKDVKTMQLGDDMESLFYPAAPAVDPSMSMSIDSSLNVSQLIGQLTSTVSNAMDTTPHQAPTVDLTSVAAVQSLRPDQLQQLLAQISSSMGVAGQQQLQFGQYGATPPNSGGNDAVPSVWGSTTPHHFSDYSGYSDEGDKQYLARWEDTGGRGGRGRGGGRGGRGEEWAAKTYSSRKSRPCLFFQQQRCKYGDQCDFLHELAPTAER